MKRIISQLGSQPLTNDRICGTIRCSLDFPKDFFYTVNIMKNIINQLSQFIKSIKPPKKSVLTFGLVILALIAVLTGSTSSAHAEVTSGPKLVLNSTQAIPVILINNQIQIVPGLAQADMDKVNVDHDPEAIKTFIQQIAPEYGVDWKLIYAIGVYESGNYGSNLARYNNNFFGRKETSTTWRKYNTAEDGIRDEFIYVKEHYINNGLDTPAKMNHIYCVGTDWQYKVQFIMDTV